MAAQTPGAKPFQRKKLYVNKSAQSRMLFFIIGFVVLGLFLFLGLTVLKMNAGALSIGALLMNLLLALILVLIGVVYSGLRFTNKIVGPVVNFSRNLQMVHRGDYTSTVRLRKGDEFQNMAGVLNQALDSLRARVREDIDFLRGSPRNWTRWRRFGRRAGV